jgi:hypothetical protein
MKYEDVGHLTTPWNIPINIKGLYKSYEIWRCGANYNPIKHPYKHLGTLQIIWNMEMWGTLQSYETSL